MIKQYQTGIVRGLENYLEVLHIISGEEGRLPKQKYHSRQGIVVFTPHNKVDISDLMARLAEIGLSTKEVV